MVNIAITYQGQLRTEAVHGPSQTKLVTDAPVDNRGKGASFSPTDLLATSLGACLVTIMGISAMDHGWDMEGTTLDIKKIMSTDAPRRVAEIQIHIRCPKPLDDKAKTILERVARACPVAHSLHPDLQQNLSFHWA